MRSILIDEEYAHSQLEALSMFDRLAGELVAQYGWNNCLVEVSVGTDSIDDGLSYDEVKEQLSRCFMEITGEIVVAFGDDRDEVFIPWAARGRLTRILPDHHVVSEVSARMIDEAQKLVEHNELLIKKVTLRLRSMSWDDLKGSWPTISEDDCLVQQVLTELTVPRALQAAAEALFYHSYGELKIQRIHLCCPRGHEVPNPESSVALETDKVDLALRRFFSDRKIATYCPRFKDEQSDLMDTLQSLAENPENSSLTDERVIRAWYEIQEGLHDSLRYPPPEIANEALRRTQLSLSAAFAGALAAEALAGETPTSRSLTTGHIGCVVPWLSSAEEAIAVVGDCYEEAERFVDDKAEAIRFLAEWIMRYPVMDSVTFTDLVEFSSP